MKNKCCLYIIITIRLFSITICNLLIDLHSYHSGDQIKKNEMGGACGTMGDRRGAYRVGWGERRERELEVKRRIILKWLSKEWAEETGTGLLWVKIAAGGGMLCMR